MKLGEPDASGRRRPVEVPGSEFAMPADMVIAHRRWSMNSLLGHIDVKSEGGLFQIDPVTGQTSVEGFLRVATTSRVRRQ